MALQAISGTGGRRFFPHPQLGGLHQRRAAGVVIIFDLAVEALEALGGDDLAALLNRPHRARALAQMARIAAFGTALEHIDEVQPVEDRQKAAERTQKAAIGPFGEKPDRQQDTSVDHIRPGTGEFRDDGGLERFDLGGSSRRVQLGHHQHQHHGGGDVFAEPQALLQGG